MYNLLTECLSDKELQFLEKNTVFDSEEINGLFERFMFLDKRNTGYLSFADFQMIPEFFSNPFRALILSYIEETINEYEKMNFAYFLDFLAIFHRKTPKSERINFLFSIFDLNKDHKLCRGVLREIYKIMGGCQPYIDGTSADTLIEEEIDEIMKYDVGKKEHLDIVDFNRLYSEDPALEDILVIDFKKNIPRSESEAGICEILWQNK